MTNEPLGLPKGSVRAVMSLTVVVAAALLATILLLREPSSELTKVVIGGWATALGNVIGFYFGARAGE